MKYSVKMTMLNGHAAYLSFRGRSEWSKRVALRHMRDVEKDVRFSSFYCAFSLEEN